MSLPLDAQGPTTLFEGKVKNIEYYTTAKEDVYTLVFIRGVEKPLAFPKGWHGQVPVYGDHVSAADVTEGHEFFFVGHRSVVSIKPPDFEVWKTPTKIDASRREQAEGIVLEYLRKHGEVSADDVCNPICDLFPERDRRVVGAIFLRLSKQGIIHKFGSKPSERKDCHASPIPIWHEVKKAH